MPVHTPDSGEPFRLVRSASHPTPATPEGDGGKARDTVTDVPPTMRLVRQADGAARRASDAQARRGEQPGRATATLDTDGDYSPRERNQLLHLLAHQSPAAYERLAELLESVDLDTKVVLYEPGEPITHVYFPQTGAYSIVKIMKSGARVEVGTVGCEGMIGLPVFLGAESTPTQCFAQIGGSAWRLSAAAFRSVVLAGDALHRILQRYAQYLFDQAAQSVACNRLHAVEARCARWLLMTHDRVGDVPSFPLTHEFLSYMLGVRRASVSIAAESLQRAGLIRYSRGKMTIVDRTGLEAASCECYRTDSADLERLLGADSVLQVAR
jgi:CRP-like cAMP-binding protein